MTTIPTDIVDAARAADADTIGDEFEPCDRCGHRSYVIVTKLRRDAARLTFCGHHGTRYLPKLEQTGWFVIDGRGRIPR